MWQHMFSRLGIGLLSAVAAFGLSEEGAIGGDRAAAPVTQNPQHASSSQTVSSEKESRSQTHVSLESICRIRGEGRSIFTKDGKLTLVLKEGCTGYLAAQEIAEAINGPQILFQNNSRLVAMALDQTAIEVDVPTQYANDPVHFICQLLKLRLAEADLGQPVPAPADTARQARVAPPMCRMEKTSIEWICRIRGEGENIYTKDGRITLALHEDFASYRVAQNVAETINGMQIVDRNDGEAMATALDRANIEVAIPSQYRDDPVAFLSRIMSLPMSDPAIEEPVAMCESQCK